MKNGEKFNRSNIMYAVITIIFNENGYVIS